MADLSALSSDTLLHYYEDIRRQVAADAKPGNPYRFIGRAAKDRADALLSEIRRRGLTIMPIDWPDNWATT